MSGTPGRESELEAALEACLTSRDNGHPPDEETLTASYPGAAGEVKELVDNLRFLDEELSGDAPGHSDSDNGDAATRVPAAVTEVTQTPWSAPPMGASLQLEGEKPGESLPVFPGFRILEELDGGGQGVVYRATQLSTRRQVALKVIRHGRWASQKERLRFENEVELASKLRHPNIVQVYEGGAHAGQDYYAMEFIEGKRLDLYAWEGNLSVQETVKLFLQVCEAVQYAHQRGVMHRDLKPGNILVDRGGQAHILDFGLAKPVNERGTSVQVMVTQEGEFTGTWAYASPEQVRRDPTAVDTRSDVYALGVILYELLTKVLPYPIRDGSREDATRYVLEYPIGSPRKHRKEVSEDLATVMLQALARDVTQRYQSAGALAEDLGNVLAGRAITARRASRWYVLRKAARRYRVAIAIVLAVFAALTTFAITSWRLYVKAADAQATTEARSKTVRHAQRFTERELEKLNWLTNLVPLLKAPNVPDWVKARFSRQATPEEEPDWKPLAETIPNDLLKAVRDPTRTDHSAALAWLEENRDELARLAVELRTKRIVTTSPAKEAAGYLFHDEDRFGFLNLTRAYQADGEIALWSGNFERAVQSLEAARLIELDAGDGRSGLVASGSFRHDVLRPVLHTLSRRGAGPDGRALLSRFLMEDPPPSNPGLLLPTVRAQAVQLLEGGVVAGRAHPDGVIDFDLVIAAKAGNDGDSPSIPDADRRASRAIAPGSVIDALDRYYAGIFSLAEAPLRVINAQHEGIRNGLINDPSFPVTRWMLLATINVRGFGRARAERSAAILAGCVCLYEVETGHWPKRLEDAVSEAHREHLIDPYTEQPFGYQVVDGMARIYSVGEDFTDNGGVHGGWEQPGTDVVLFPPQGD